MGLFVKRDDTSIVNGYYQMESEPPKLIIGLGNVGQKYHLNRHNVGFRILDAFVAEQKGTWHEKKTVKSLISELKIGQYKVIVAKPITLMNNSGLARHALSKFYKISTENTLVVYDDIDVIFGTIRTRVGGGSGGHNGVKSLISHGDDGFKRLRIGIANEFRAHTDAADFVLDNFNRGELSRLPHIIDEALDYIDSFIRGEFKATSIKTDHKK